MSVENCGDVCRAPACLCVLCGLPAAGKSTLAVELLRAAAQRGWRAIIVPYDDLIPDQAFKTKVEGDSAKFQEMVNLDISHTEWKLHRQAVLCCIENFLEEPQVSAEQPSSCQVNMAAWEKCIKNLQQPGVVDKAPLLFLLDDNFYYPSMRYEVYQLARKYSLGFSQVYLQCDSESCIRRNQSRSKPIPTDVILEMVKRLEPPNPKKNSWETNSILLNTTNNLLNYDIHRVMELISSALSNPLSPVEDNTEQMEADRLKCANSVVHQADQACRRLISDAMKTSKDNQVPPERMKCLAAQLNESKSTFLHNLRRQLLQEAIYTQEDVDVERVVKRAVSVFDHERKEITSRIMNGI